MVAAVRVHKTGGPDVLTYEDVDIPAPGQGQVKIKTHAAGINFIDTYFRMGMYPSPVGLPFIAGNESAGEVIAVGPGVSDLKVGDRVAYVGALGGYAAERLVPADRAVKMPDNISYEQAAGMMLKGMTAQYLLKRTFAVQKGQTILWHAAAGGVGLIACQWARHLGATVIGTVGSDEKVALAKDNGCTHVLNTRSDNWVARVREITNGEGVPVVYDSVGKDTWDGSLDCLAVRGMMVSFGNASGAVPPFAPGILSAKGSLYLTRPTLFHYARNAAELQETADDLFDAIAKGIVRIAIHQRFNLEDARAAHEALHSRTTTGATILIP